MAQTFIYLFFYIYVGIWLYKKNLVLKKTDFKKLYKTLVTLSRPWSKRNIYICIERKREAGEEKRKYLQLQHPPRHFWSHRRWKQALSEIGDEKSRNRQETYWCKAWQPPSMKFQHLLQHRHWLGFGHCSVLC